jgi:hypothetical protein
MLGTATIKPMNPEEAPRELQLNGEVAIFYFMERDITFALIGT